MNDTIEDAILLKQVPDTKDPSLTLYTTEVALPTMTTADVVLQVIWHFMCHFSLSLQNRSVINISETS